MELVGLVTKKISFVIINGENSADNGLGITKKNAEELFVSGVDVITTGNHVWDQKETIKFIDEETRLLRPYNFAEGSPGKGYDIFISKNNKKEAKTGVFFAHSEPLFC